MKTMLLALAATAFLGGPEEGRAWLDKAEQRLYAWPKPGSTVQFKVRTDILDGVLAMLQKEVEARPGEETQRAVDALRRVTISGSIDTGTGVVTTEVVVPFETDDPARQASIDKVKNGITTMVSKSFEGLPLHDPKMLGKDNTVVECSEERDSVRVTVAGKSKDDGKAEGDRTVIHLDKRRGLPERFEGEAMQMKLRYTEVLPGKFAPAHLEVKMGSGGGSSAEYTYQRVGSLVFPATVKVVSGPQRVSLRFESVSIAPPQR